MFIFLVEFFGIMVFIILGGGVCVGVVLKKIGLNDFGWIVIIMGWVLVVILVIYVVGFISGVYINLVVILVMVVVGEFDWVKVFFYILV